MPSTGSDTHLKPHYIILLDRLQKKRSARVQARALQARDQLRQWCKASADARPNKYERKLEQGLARLGRWAPAMAWFSKIYQILAEFGVQMAITLFLGFVIIGLFKAPSALLVVTAYSVLVITLAARYVATLALINQALSLGHSLIGVLLEDEADELLGEEFHLGREDIGYIRREFLKASALQAVSLLVVLFFVARIIGSEIDFVGFDVKKLIGDSIITVIGVLLSFGLAPSVFSASIFQNLLPKQSTQ